MIDYTLSRLPKQKISESEKTEEWHKQCADAIIGASYSQTAERRSSPHEKQVNYDLYNGIFDENDFKHVTNPYGIKDMDQYGGSPVKMQNYNIFREVIDPIMGEEIMRPFKFMARAVGGEASKVREDKLKQELLSSALKMVEYELGLRESLSPEELPEHILSYYRMDYVDIREKITNDLLAVLVEKERLKYIFNKGFKHTLLVGEEIYYVGIVNGQPKVRVVNPLFFDFERNGDSEWIQDASWCTETRHLPVSQIVDEYGEYLTDEEIDDLEKGNFRHGFRNYHPDFVIPYNENTNRSYPEHQQGIEVTNACWKSYKRICFLSYIDENGRFQQRIVDGGFKLSSSQKKAGFKTEYQWVIEIRKCTRIGNQIYVDYGLVENQSASLYQVNTATLPYVGKIYNADNSIAKGIVDLIKTHAYTYNVLWFRLEMELQKAKGKKIVLDSSLKPTHMEMEQWLYHMDNLGIVHVETKRESDINPGGNNDVQRTQNGMVIDMTLSATINQYLLIMNKLENVIERITGVNPQRKGQIAASETVGGVERAMTQSSYVTMQLFSEHNEVKKKVMDKIIETAKIAYIEGGTLEYFTEDGARLFLQMQENQFLDSDFAVFLTDSNKEFALMESLKGVAERAVASGKMEIEDLMSIYRGNSTADIENKVKTAANNRRNIEQQMQQQAKEIEQMRMDSLREEREWKANENQKDRDTKIEVAQLTAMSYDKTKDYDGNQKPDYLELEKLRSRERIEDTKLKIAKENKNSAELKKSKPNKK